MKAKGALCIGSVALLVCFCSAAEVSRRSVFCYKVSFEQHSDTQSRDILLKSSLRHGISAAITEPQGIDFYDDGVLVATFIQGPESYGSLVGFFREGEFQRDFTKWVASVDGRRLATTCEKAGIPPIETSP